MPLPPYILKRRQAEGVSKTCDDEWYQTVYAQEEGSVAAPTAGLHFTRDLLEQFNHAFLTLHVGLGTFRPIKTKYVEEHVMHEEEFLIPEGLAEKAKQAKRVVSVGTTTVRVLETKPSLMPEQGKTDIYIYPPYKFKRVDALITNFHLPHSTLLLLVAAFMGKELLRQAYAEAIERDYRFYSYGDAMLIL
jgi:S-adenosylmethionine:tRNA ribosyltransferase-isomerase